ncbi:MAG: transcriptional repressor [Armatimonadetes bacterium]|nr:transcriptional repressor [Armatimonadota bacterium]
MRIASKRLKSANVGGKMLVVRDNFETKAIDTLKRSGLRMTGPRVLVIRTLASAEKALTPQDVYQKVKQSGGQVDLVSVYRTLETLRELDLIHYIGVAEGYAPCHIEHGDSGVEHFVCRTCGTVQEFEANHEALTAAVKELEENGIKVDSVRIEIQGSCESCQTKEAK